MNLILVIGECYSGKDFLIHKMRTLLNDSFVINVGDLLRAEEKDPNHYFSKDTVIPGAKIVEVISSELHKASSSFVIINNPMKNIEQAEAILEMLNEWEFFPGDIRVIWLHNKRTSFSYSSRKRADDSLITQKLADWEKQQSA